MDGKGMRLGRFFACMWRDGLGLVVSFDIPLGSRTWGRKVGEKDS